MNLWYTIAGLAGIWFLVVTIPGPNFVVITRYSMSDSRKSGQFIAFGVSIGAGMWATASLLGLNIVFDHAPWLYDTIRFIGGIYLIFIGLKTIWNSFHSWPLSIRASQFTGTTYSAFRRGLFTSFLNPKTAAFFGSLFIATLPPQAPAWFYFVTVSIIISVSFIWYSLIAYFFSISKVQLVYNKLKTIFDKITGSVLLLLGARLAFTRT